MRLNRLGDRRGMYKKTQSHRLKISKALKGRKFVCGDPVARGRKISASLKKSKAHRRHCQALKGVKRNSSTKRKISETRKRLGLRPQPTAFARQLHKLLGAGWKLEFYIGRGRGTYPVDIANPKAKVVIECDGKSHDNKWQRKRDRLRDSFLRSKGWHVIRVREDESA